MFIILQVVQDKGEVERGVFMENSWGITVGGIRGMGGKSKTT